MEGGKINYNHINNPSNGQNGKKKMDSLITDEQQEERQIELDY